MPHRQLTLMTNRVFCQAAAPLGMSAEGSSFAEFRDDELDRHKSALQNRIPGMHR